MPDQGRDPCGALDCGSTDSNRIPNDKLLSRAAVLSGDLTSTACQQ
ncbi:MAG TPA: hypothetical protein VN517_16700 [Terriglobales bacterium]|nr:hypothetical protein [Terriglobales bacterium]